MDENINEKIDMIEFENLIYLLLIFAALLNIDTNERLKNLYKNNKTPNESIRNEYLFASFVGLYVFSSFLKRNYNTLNNLEEGTEEYELSKLRVIGSYFFIIGQLIVIYYLLNTSTYEDSPI